MNFTAGFAQEEEESPGKRRNKGKLYAFQGWNREHYTNSDIHFTGDTYDFTLKSAVAEDRQTSFIEYFNPNNLTGPQTNVRVGYFFADHWDIAIGLDHMKYVMPQDQTARADGIIADSGTGSSEAKGGFIHMPDIRTTSDPSDRAGQHFGYFQYNILFGAAIPPTKQ